MNDYTIGADYRGPILMQYEHGTNKCLGVDIESMKKLYDEQKELDALRLKVKHD